MPEPVFRLPRDPAPQASNRTRIRIGLAIAALCVAGVLAVTIFPTPVDEPVSGPLKRLLAGLHQHGLPSVVGYAAVEFSANVMMFVPVGFALALLPPRRLWWVGVIAGSLLSALIEAAQWLMLPERTPSVSDILANSVGALLGAGIALLVRVAAVGRAGTREKRGG